jgi:hypothetical protein
MSDRDVPRKRGNGPLIAILVVGGLIMLVAIGYAAMVASGPMPGMGH